jgi:monoamine oxidase
MGRTPLFRKLIMTLQQARRQNLERIGQPLPMLLREKKWPRRKFLKTALAAGIAGISGPGLLFPQQADAHPLPKNPKIAIIGAGIAGLNAAYHLKRAGYSAIVYEARSRIGGRMRSVDAGNGLIVDLGAELINIDHADMLTLVEDFGIELFNRQQDQAGVPYPESAYFFEGNRIEESDLAEDLQEIAAQITADAALLDADWDAYAPKFDKLSVADYLTLHAEKIPKPYLHRLLRDVIRTEYGVEAEHSSAIQLILVLPVIDGQSVDLLSYSDETYSVVGGSAKITDALGKALPGQILLRKRLVGLDMHVHQFVLHFSDHSVEYADVVIMALPFPVLKQVDVKVPLPKLLRRFIHEAGLGSNEKLISEFNERFWRQEDGFTDAAWSDCGFAEVWDETQRQSERIDGALNFFLGGDQTAQLQNRKRAEQLAYKFISRLGEFVPGAEASATGRILFSGWTQSPYTLGGYANFKPGQLTKFGRLFWIESDIASERQTVNVGNLIFAGEHLSDAYYGFMNGGAETGRLAAGLVLEKLTAKNSSAG